jgi:lysozyme family protein
VSTFDQAVNFVLKYEGGYVDNPDDPGGETNYGISKKAYPDLDIKNLTRDEAIAIYRRDYWDKCRCDELPASLAIITFDSAVNQGPSRAVKLLQKSLSVTADGVMGSQTIAAANKVEPSDCVPEFIAQRAFAYGTNENVNTFGLGWFRRLAACHQLALEPL